ncbi:hypothetical protein EV126DRAFT_256147 [Verticillium dahliae]|nr:hypothetical protein EV126DRAFT_256147 [Verticillium dahliae]
MDNASSIPGQQQGRPSIYKPRSSSSLPLKQSGPPAPSTPKGPGRPETRHRVCRQRSTPSRGSVPVPPLLLLHSVWSPQSNQVSQPGSPSANILGQRTQSLVPYKWPSVVQATLCGNMVRIPCHSKHGIASLLGGTRSMHALPASSFDCHQHSHPRTHTHLSTEPTTSLSSSCSPFSFHSPYLRAPRPAKLQRPSAQTMPGPVGRPG